MTEKRVGLVFVHGFLSSAKTWSAFVERLRDDDELRDLAVVAFEYATPVFEPSPLRRIPNFDDIADNFATYYSHELARFDELIVVTHSQGGLVVQRFLARMLARARGLELARIRRVVMFACPNSGSELLLHLRKGVRFWRNPQEHELRPINRAITEAQQIVLERVVNADRVSQTECRIPIVAYAGDQDNVVQAQSATFVFPVSGTIPGDHFTVIQPDSDQHRSYTTLRVNLLAALRDTDASEAVGPASPPPADRTERRGGVEQVAQYICYVSRDRLDSLFHQLDVDALTQPPLDNPLGHLPFGHPAAATQDPRTLRATVSRLAAVRDHLERAARIGDLAAIVAAHGRLEDDCYLASTDFRVTGWDPAQPSVYLEGQVGDYVLRLSCAKRNFSGLGQEDGMFIPTSTNRFLFEDRVALPMQGLIWLAGVDVQDRRLLGSPLYLVLNPLRSDLGEYSDVVL